MPRLLAFIIFGGLIGPSFGLNPAVSRHPANIVGTVDGRAPLFREYRTLKLSALETIQIRSAVGYVNCGRKDDWVTGFLIAPDVVVTVAHVFQDENGARVGPRESCFFRTQGDYPRLPIPLSGRAGDLILGTANPYEWRLRDWAVARLQRPVPGANPFSISRQPVQLREWNEILPVSAYRAEKYRQPGESTNEPLGQLCFVRRGEPAEPDRPSYFFSDCDNTDGGSGSPVLTRLRNGRLAVVGMFEGAGKAADGTEYSDGNPMSAAIGLGIDSLFLKAIFTLSPNSVSN